MDFIKIEINRKIATLTFAIQASSCTKRRTCRRTDPGSENMRQEKSACGVVAVGSKHQQRLVSRHDILELPEADVTPSAF